MRKSQMGKHKMREKVMGLGTLVTTYVDAINSGAVPCLDDAVTTLAQRENSAAVQKAADHSSEQMAQRLRLPTDTLQELLGIHSKEGDLCRRMKRPL
nr:guanylate-binding protein 4-like [Peromyscus maniculatus bairdii]